MTTTCSIEYPTRTRDHYAVWVPLRDTYQGSQLFAVAEYWECEDGRLVGGDGTEKGGIEIGPPDAVGWRWRVEMADGRVASGRAVSLEWALRVASKRYFRLAGAPVAQAR